MGKKDHSHGKHRAVLKGKSNAKKIGIVFSAMLPMVLSAAWLVFLTMPAKPSRFALSPSRVTPLTIGLIIFMLGYVAFLFMMFSEDIKDFYEHSLKHKSHH
ncbi:MAG: hypothetical protein V1859_09455 [archaeon]